MLFRLFGLMMCAAVFFVLFSKASRARSHSHTPTKRSIKKNDIVERIGSAYYSGVYRWDGPERKEHKIEEKGDENVKTHANHSTTTTTTTAKFNHRLFYSIQLRRLPVCLLRFRVFFVLRVNATRRWMRLLLTSLNGWWHCDAFFSPSESRSYYDVHYTATEWSKVMAVSIHTHTHRQNRTAREHGAERNGLSGV